MISIGAEVGALANSFSGVIDEMAVFDRPLPEDEIKRLAGGGSLGAAPLNPLGLAVRPGSAPGTIELSWNSTLGKLYDVLANADLNSPRASWAPVAGAVDLPGDASGRSSVEIPLPFPGEGYVAISEKDPPPLFFDDFESDTGWTNVANPGDSGDTAWQRGAPNTGTGPTSGADGSATAFSTNLAEYQNNANISLRSPTIDLSGLAVAELRMDYWRDADGNSGDTASIRFLNAGDLTPLGAATAIDVADFDLDWESFSTPIPAEAIGQMVIIEITFTSTTTGGQFSGLSIDNVSIEIP